MWEQLSKVCSLPVQLSRSRSKGPVPCPKCAFRNYIAPIIYKTVSSQSFSVRPIMHTHTHTYVHPHSCTCTCPHPIYIHPTCTQYIHIHMVQLHASKFWFSFRHELRPKLTSASHHWTFICQEHEVCIKCAQGFLSCPQLTIFEG